MNATQTTQLMQAVEVMGTIEGDCVKLDALLPSGMSGRVRVVILTANEIAGQNASEAVDDGSEVTPDEWKRNLAANPSFAFLHDPAEDIYTLEDGEAVSS